MKVYFVGSIRGKKKYQANYETIVNLLKSKGHDVFEDTIRPSENEVYTMEAPQKSDFVSQVNKWIAASDIVIAEISFPSVGVGYEIAHSVSKGKPVVVLADNADAMHFVDGIIADKLVTVQYTNENLEAELSSAIEYASDIQDTRFNFFISPKHQNYLDWISKERKIPRAVFLRNLIEREMENDEEFSG